MKKSRTVAAACIAGIALLLSFSPAALAFNSITVKSDVMHIMATDRDRIEYTINNPNNKTYNDFEVPVPNAADDLDKYTVSSTDVNVKSKSFTVKGGQKHLRIRFDNTNATSNVIRITGPEAEAHVAVSKVTVTVNGNVRAQDDAPAFAMFTTVLPTDIPTVSEWGMITFGLLLLAGGTIVVRRYRYETSAQERRIA